MSEPGMQHPDGPSRPEQRYGALLAIGGGMASRVATLVLLLVLPSHIGLSAYGMFVLVITLGEIIEMTTSNWYRILLVRHGVNGGRALYDAPTRTAGERPGWTYAAVIAGLSLLAFAATALLSPLVAQGPNLEFMTASLAYVFAFILFKLAIAILQAQGRSSLIGAFECLRGVLMLMLTMGALMLAPAGFLSLALALALAALLAAVACLITVRRDLHALLRSRLDRGAFVRLGAPLVLTVWLTYQIGWLDRIIIQALMGPEMVGLYVAVAAIARQPIDLVLSALNTQTFPLMMARDIPGAEARARASGVLAAVCVLGLGCAGAIVALAQPLAQAVLPAFDHSTASTLIAPVCIGAVLLGIKHFAFDNVFHAHGKNWLMLRWLTVVSFAAIALSAILIWRYSVHGAAIGFLIGAGAALASSMLVSRRFWAFPVPVGAVARIAGAVVIAALAAHYTAVYAMQNLDGDATVWFALGAGALIYCMIYLAGLMALLRFDPRRFAAAPWDWTFKTGATC